MITKKPVASLVWLPILLAMMPTYLSAQGFIPQSTWSGASAFEEGKALYVKGGLSILDLAKGQAQMFSIDLSVPWDTSSVPYKQIDGSGPDELVSATLTKDSKKLVMFGETISRVYDIAAGTWSDIPLVVSIDHRIWSRVMNPNTGKIYAIDGYEPYFENFRPIQMHEYDPSSGAIQTILMTPGSEDPLSDVQASWNPFTEKMVLFGKDIYQSRYQYFRTWDSIGGWSAMMTKGTPPFDRNYGCFAQAYNGTKLVLFGGIVPGRYLDDIYIFDVATATWTQGTSAGAANARYGAVGAVTNDLFVTWGGRTMEGEVTSNIVLIYNMKTNAWQTNYTPSPSSIPTMTQTNTASPSPSGPSAVTPSPSGPSAVTPSPSGPSAITPLPSGSNTASSPSENPATLSSTESNTSTLSATRAGDPLTTTSATTTPSSPIPTRPPTLGDGKPSQPLSNQNTEENNSPRSDTPNLNSKTFGPVLGATSGGLMVIVCAIGLHIFLRRKHLRKMSLEKNGNGRLSQLPSFWSSTDKLNQDPFRDDFYSPEDLDKHSHSLQPISISYSVRDFQPCEEPSLPVSNNARGPQSTTHGWSSQLPALELHTRRQPEDTGEPWISNNNTSHVDHSNDGTMIIAETKTMDSTLDGSSYEGTLPKNGSSTSPVSRDPQHPRGYGDFETRVSQSEESPLPINDTIQSSQALSSTISDSYRSNEDYDRTTLVHDSIQYSGRLGSTPDSS